VIVGVALSLVATAALIWVIVDRREDFSTAVGTVSWPTLLLATLLQLAALVIRTEAWHICVEAAGATCGRRPLYHASALGSLGSQLNSQVGTAARIAILRREAPGGAPRIPALIAAEVPILAIEGSLAALTCFTLIGPLNAPWWAAVLVVLLAAAIVGSLVRLAEKRPNGIASGLAVLRTLDGAWKVFALIMLATFSQIGRNWIMLRAVGTDASVFDAIAVLILQVGLSQLPIGPGVGAGAVGLVLGVSGEAALGITTAAGVLLTATGTAGALLYLAWGVVDRFGIEPRRRRAARGVDSPP
jgi:hypothetical protein